MNLNAFKANRNKDTAKYRNPREIRLSPRNTLSVQDLLARGKQVNASFLSYRLNPPFRVGAGKGCKPNPEGRDQVEESNLLGQLQGPPDGEREGNEPSAEDLYRGPLRRASTAVYERLLRRHERASAHGGAGPGRAGASFSQVTPSTEKFIWNHNFAHEGLPGTQRGRILEWMYGVPWRSNTPSYDINGTHVQQIRSTRSYYNIESLVRKATMDAYRAIFNDRLGSMQGKRAQAVIITPTDAPANVDWAIRRALDPSRSKNVPENAAPPEHIRGLPGKIGSFGNLLTGLGLAFTAYGLLVDYRRGDISMALGDSLGLAASSFQLYARLSPGALIAASNAVTAVTAGIVLSGAGIAVTSGVSLYRAWKRRDFLRIGAGVVGVAAGVATMAGITGIAASLAWAPLLAVGECTAFGVGVLGLGLGMTLPKSQGQPHSLCRV